MERMTCKSDYFGHEESVLCDGVNYEDTGLHPEVIGALQKREQDLLQMLSDKSKQLVFSYNDLREIARALADGRLPWPLPNDPLTLEQLREMDGEPVYGSDGECYIVNAQNEYAADKYRGFRMLWEEGFFFRYTPEERQHDT